MLTIYEILEVEENASKEEIELAYSRLILEFRQDPNFDDETNKQNELIVNRLKLAYEILINDEKRKRYDDDLAKKRAENLIAGVVVEEPKKEEITNNESTTNAETNIKQDENDIIQRTNINQGNTSDSTAQNQQTYKEVYKNTEEQELLSEKEKKDIRKAAKKEFNDNLKKVKQAEAEYNEAYNKAYNDYLRKNGYKVKEPLTLKKIIKVFISIIIMIVVCIVLWCIPPIREILMETYNNNFIIKAIVDLVKMIFEAIIGIF